MSDSDNDKHSYNVDYIIGICSLREEWSKWANKQKLIDDEAIPLMNGLDPASWKEYIDGGEKSFPIEMIQSIERCLIIAKAEDFKIATPIEWLAWGRIHDLNKPILKSDAWLNEPDTCMFYLFETAVNAVSNALKPNQSGKQEIDKSRTNHIPGTMPRIAIGRIVVTEAWEIEQKTGRRATARVVLEELQTWANNGQKYSSVLHPHPDKFRGTGVYWITSKTDKKLYSLAACEKALEKWNKSRK